MKALIKFLKDEEGVTAIEYGLIAAGIGIAIAVVVYSVGNSLENLFNTVENALN